jgi:hypothetical protein
MLLIFTITRITLRPEINKPAFHAAYEPHTFYDPR